MCFVRPPMSMNTTEIRSSHDGVVPALRSRRSRNVARWPLIAGAVAGTLLASHGASAAQIFNDAAWLRTPVATPSSTFSDLTCDSCQWSTPKARWRLATKGLYSVILPGKAHAANEPAMFHAMAFGSPGVACRASDGGISGKDQWVSVSCLDSSKQAVNSRFELYYEVEPRAGYMDPSGGRDPHGARAFATVFNNQLMPGQYYNPAGPTPEITRFDVGRFKVYFPGFMEFSGGGNALVTPLYPINQCSLVGWDVAWDTAGNATGSYAYVACRSFGVYADAAFVVSYTNRMGLGETDRTVGLGVILSDQASGFTNYTPNSWWNDQSLSGPMSVTRNGPGDYTVNAVPGVPLQDAVGAMVSPVNASAVCGTTAVDRFSVRLLCTSPSSATPVDTPFSMEIGSVEKFPFHRAWSQVTLQNFGSNAFDVGYGLWCAQEITSSNRVKCGLPGNLDAGFFLPTSSGGSKGLAIWNVDRLDTTIYVLGLDDYTRVFRGNLSQPLGTATNFGSIAFSVKPVLQNTNQVIGIKRVVALSGRVNLAVGLTGGNQLVEVTGSTSNAQWMNLVSLKNLPAGVTAKDISHGPDGLYVLTTANTIYRLTPSAATLLPPLPNGLSPITVGGPYAITDAGINAEGVLCTLPWDTSRNAFTCPGDDQRFYFLAGDGNWHAINPGLKLPTEDDPSMKKSVNPFASSAGAIVDARAFDGNVSEFWAWQVFSRIYRFID